MVDLRQIVSAALGVVLVATSPAAHADTPSEEASIALLPVTSTGKVDRHRRKKIDAALLEGVERSRFRVVPPSELAARKDTCDDPSCARDVASAAGTTHVVRTKVEVRRKDYHVTLELVSGTDGKVDVSVEDTCEVCGVQETATLVSDLAASLVRKLEERMQPATLLLDSDPPGAKVTVDGESIGTTPLEVEVEPGTHQLQVEKPGFSPQVRDIDITGGVRERMSVSLAPEQRDQGASKIPAWAGWTLVGAGSAATITGIVLIAVDERPIKSNCDGNNLDEFGNCRYRQNTLPAGAALMAVGLAAVAAGVALVVVRRKQMKSGAHARVRPGLGGLVVRF